MLDTTISYKLGDYWVRVTAILPHGRGESVIYHKTGSPMTSLRMPLREFQRKTKVGAMHSGQA